MAVITFVSVLSMMKFLRMNALGSLFALSNAKLFQHMRDVKSLPRIHVQRPMEAGNEFQINESLTHYICTVMRIKEGFQFRSFNNDGEYLCRVLASPNKSTKLKHATIIVDQKLRSGDTSDFPCVLFVAPLKKPKFKLLLEKATELGVGHIVPVTTKHTNAPINDQFGEQYAACLMESSEQCERLSLPTLHDVITLDNLLCSWQSEYSESLASPNGMSKHAPWLLVCQERMAAGNPLMTTLQQIDFGTTSRPIPVSSASASGVKNVPGSFGLLVGPEGGWSAEESELFKSYEFIRPVSLGKSVLRAETAAICAMSVVAATADELESRKEREQQQGV